MPSDPRPLCHIPVGEQISHGQAGPEVNRDLESLFGLARSFSSCVSKIADYLNSNTSGGFGLGNSGSGGGTGGGGSTMPPPIIFRGGELPVTRVSSGSSFTVMDGFSGILMIDATADITVTLRPPLPGIPLVLVHSGGAFTITVNDDTAAAIGTLAQFEIAIPGVKESSVAVPLWHTGLVVFTVGGGLRLKDDVTVVGSGNGMVLQSPNGNYHRISVDNAGALSTSDLGAAPP